MKRSAKLPFTLLFTVLSTVFLFAENVSLAKYERFAMAIDSSMYFSDVTLLNERVDVEGILVKAMENMDLEEALRNGAIDGAMNRFDFGSMVLGAIGESGDYSFLRMITDKGDVRALFRLRAPDFKLNYHELVLEDRNGEIMIADVYVYLVGEMLSESFSKVFGSLFTQIEANENFAPELAAAQSFMAAKKDCDYAKVCKLYKKLPRNLKENKVVIMQYIDAAASVGVKKHQKAMAVYEKHFPADPSLSLLLMDKYFAAGRYDEALACVERLNSAVRGDDYLKFYKSTILCAMGRYEESVKLCKELIKTGDFTYLAYVNLININYKQENYAGVLNNLLYLKELLNLQPEEIVETASIPGFFQSNTWNAWVVENRRP